ncbi:MAG: FkbM family methyltransferase [Alphaproteobacteria bacterium]|nr:FkbM family methyltransferase [Alphaproteobacteria bacterium]
MSKFSVSFLALSLVFQLSANNNQETVDNNADTSANQSIQQENAEAGNISENNSTKNEEQSTDFSASNTQTSINSNEESQEQKENAQNTSDNQQSEFDISSQDNSENIKNTDAGSENITTGTNEESNETSDKKEAALPENSEVVAIETPDLVQTLDIKTDADAPAVYTHLVPITGWSRYSGDSAMSLSGWGRWWTYLNMKTPVLMNWIDGLIVRIYPDNEIFRSIYVNGIYDPNSIVAINTLLPKDGIFIDVGASFGLFSLLATKSVGANGHIYAIEPSYRDYSRLVDNININNLGNSISSYRLAISNTSETVLLNIATEERSALNTLGKEFSFKGIEKISQESVDAIALDDFVIANQIKHVDVIKLDIEGSELKALQGALKTIEKFHPAIMLGVNSNALKAAGTDHDEIQKIISEINYKAYKLVDEDDNLKFELIPDLTKESAKIVFCLPADVVPPKLPQPKHSNLIEHIKDFFVR